MRYISTRGQAPPVSFLDAVLAGMAPDGGLYVPEHWPTLDADVFNASVNGGYADTAGVILETFAGGDLSADEAGDLACAAYDGFIEPRRTRFAHDAVAPLVQLGGGAWLMELFHGPSLSFKDVAMQLIARLYDHVLAKRGERLSIVCATSGDTGGAAVEAFKGASNADLFVLIPQGRVSDVQQRFMTTSGASNVYCALVEGDFDLCQRTVKGLFQDAAFARRARLSAVNSINWARIVAQSVYFAIASSVLAKLREAERVSFVVPTGNFGDIYSAFVAGKIGAPVGDLLAAVNSNDFLARGYVQDGRYEIVPAAATISPAMDIARPSNFERYAFERLGRDGARTRELFETIEREAGFDLDDGASREARIAAQTASEEETIAAMRSHLEHAHALICPHTAVGRAAGRAFEGRLVAPVVYLATAHPAKFPDIVERATGVRPQLPPQCADLFQRSEKFDSLPADAEAVKCYIRERSRAWS